MEVELQKIIKEAEKNDFGYLLRDGKNDIDLFSDNINKLKDFLISKGFVLFFSDNSKYKFYKFYNGKIFLLDVELNFDYISNLFFNKFKFDLEFDREKYLKHKIQFDSIRYILFFRKDKIDFLKSNFDFLKTNGFFFDKLSHKVFRKEFINLNDFESFLKQKPYFVFKYLTIRFFILLYVFQIKRFLKIFFKRLFSNNTFSIVGYDGSGKSTIVELLSTNFGVESIYMGFKRFHSRFYFHGLLQNKFTKILRLFLLYFDFLLLYIKIFFYKIKGEFVFFDRHPKYDIYPNSKDAEFILKIFFSFYPSVKKNFILYNDSEIILERKKERTMDEINTLNKYIKNNLSKKKNNVMIKNDTIDETLNIILKEMYN